MPERQRDAVHAAGIEIEQPAGPPAEAGGREME
jgi:hypothetical protein